MASVIERLLFGDYAWVEQHLRQIRDVILCDDNVQQPLCDDALAPAMALARLGMPTTAAAAATELPPLPKRHRLAVRIHVAVMFGMMDNVRSSVLVPAYNTQTIEEYCQVIRGHRHRLHAPALTLPLLALVQLRSITASHDLHRLISAVFAPAATEREAVVQATDILCDADALQKLLPAGSQRMQQRIQQRLMPFFAGICDGQLAEIGSVLPNIAYALLQVAYVPHSKEPTTDLS